MGTEARAMGRALVGRARELIELRSTLDRAGGAVGSLVLLAGEPGIGKTRLAEEIAGEARDRGMTVLWGRCWEGGGAPAFWPWIQIVRGALREENADDDAAGDADLRGRLALLAPEVGGTDQPETASDAARFALFDAVTTFLRASSERGPLVLVLDDLHAADLPSLVLLRFAARALRDARIAIVGTYRDAEVRRDTERAAVMADVAREGSLLSLVGLDREEVGALLEQTSGAATVADMIDALHDATGGNPLFVGEMSRLMASGHRHGDIPMPDGVREAISRRLATLPRPTADILAIGAVLGTSFDVDTLAAVARLDREGTLRALDPALDPHVHVLTGHGLGVYGFTHGLIRDALYAALPSSHRIALHGLARDALAEHAPDDHLAELAHHAYEAARDGDVVPAVHWSARAAEHALGILAFEEAVAHLERALEAIDRTPDRSGRLEVMLRLADALWRAGRLARARDTFLLTARDAKGAGDGPALARAALGLATVNAGSTWTPPWVADQALIATLQDALEVVPPDGAERAMMLAHLGAALHFADGSAEATELAEQSILIAQRLGDPATLAYCLAGKHLAIWHPGSAAERLAITTQILDLADAGAMEELRLQAWLWRSAALIELGELASGEAALDEYIRRSEQLRRPQYRAMVALLRATRAHVEGRFDDAVAAAQEARRFGREAGDATIAGSAAVQLWYLRSAQARIDEAMDLFDELLALHDRYRWLTAEYLMQVGRVDDARREIEIVVTEDELLLPPTAYWMPTMDQFVNLVVAVGDRARARVLYRALLPLRDAIITTGRSAILRPGPVSLRLARLATLIGELDDAVAFAEAAIRVAERAGSPVWRAEAQLALANALAHRGRSEDRARAVSLREAAVQAARGMGYGALLADAEATARDDPGAGIFRRDGEVWLVGLGGDTVRVRDARGMTYLAMLLGSPHREHPAIELVAAAEGHVRGAAGSDAGARTSGAPEDPLLDEQAMAAYRARVADLQAEIDEAEDFADPERGARAKAELEALTEALAGATGLGGRARAFARDEERARIAVTKAIKAALDRIAKAHPDLGEHLAATVRTGMRCAYAPDPGAVPDWRL